MTKQSTGPTDARHREGVGTLIYANVKADLIDLLTAPELTERQAKELFEYLTKFANPHLGRCTGFMQT